MILPPPVIDAPPAVTAAESLVALSAGLCPWHQVPTVPEVWHGVAAQHCIVCGRWWWLTDGIAVAGFDHDPDTVMVHSPHRVLAKITWDGQDRLSVKLNANS